MPIFPIFIRSRVLPTVSCMFCRSSSKNYPEALCRPHLPNGCPSTPVFYDFLYEIDLSPQSCPLFVDNFARSSPATAETETLLRRPQEPHYPKRHFFHARECFHPWIHASPNCYSSLLLPHANCSGSLCCWHDDAHMRMTWWQDCPWTFVCNSEVLELNFLW